MYSGWKMPPKRFTLDLDGMRTDISDSLKMGFSDISTFACYLGLDYEELYGEADIKEFGECIGKFAD